MFAYSIHFFYWIQSNINEEDCRRIVQALETNNCLREFNLNSFQPGKSCLPIIAEHLCRNETLNDITIDFYSTSVFEGELQLTYVSSI